jgi:DNA-binding transcriptional LysR family regulator
LEHNCHRIRDNEAFALDHLENLRVFTRVVEAGGFTAAADKLGLSRAAVSKAVIDLETELGVRLLERTTRRVRVNEVGRAYYEKCVRILAELQEADDAARQLNQTPRGTLRVNAPVSFAMLHLKPIVTRYVAEHPEVTLSIDLSDRFVDLVDEGYDLAIRIARLEDSSLVARRICAARRVLCAAPSYLAAHGTPQTPADLTTHRCLNYGTSPRADWHLIGPEGEHTVTVSGRIASNNGDMLGCAAVDGHGIALLPTFIVGPDLQSGRLQVVLPDYAPPEIAIHAVYPPNRHLAAKVRAFVDLMVDHFGPRPTWDLIE